MRRHHFELAPINRVLAVILVLLLVTPLLSADATKPVRGGTLSAGNAYYTVYVQDLHGSGVGQYTVQTGTSHPAGPGLNLLYGDGEPGTSFNTIRSYTSGTDYTQDTETKTSNFKNVLLDPYGTSTLLGSTGIRTVYNLPGPSAASNSTPDSLTIIQDVVVNGNTYQNSSVSVTTTIINNGTGTIQVGTRYLWDYQVGMDDGPTFQINNTICPPFTTEQQFASPSFADYQIVDNDTNPHPPTFDIYGTADGPATLVPTPTDPDLLDYVCWPNSFGTAFEYTIDPTLDIATSTGACQSGTGGGDCAVLYYFGHDQASATVLSAGGQITYSASMFVTPPQSAQPSGSCVTRNSRFWFTHAETNNPMCVTLQQAVLANCIQGLDLGFLNLPTLPRYGNVTDPTDISVIEGLGFYYRSLGLTGETGGTQNSRLPASALCRARKQLAVELIAANANIVLFGLNPSSCSYTSGGITTNFPSDLLIQAQTVGSGFDVTQVKTMTAFLKLFNNSGVTNQLPAGLIECSPNSHSYLRNLSRDPTTQSTCPGVNQSCTTAKVIPSLPFKDSAPLNLYQYTFPDSSCGQGGPDAVWLLEPPVAAINRHFTASTFGSNFSTILSVWSGANCSNLTAVTCSAAANETGQSEVSFTTDGTNSFYIVGEGLNGAIGELKFKVTSP